MPAAPGTCWWLEHKPTRSQAIGCRLGLPTPGSSLTAAGARTTAPWRCEEEMREEECRVPTQLRTPDLCGFLALAHTTSLELVETPAPAQRGIPLGDGPTGLESSQGDSGKPQSLVLDHFSLSLHLMAGIKLGHRGARVPGCEGPKQIGLGHLPLIKPKGREMSGVKTRKGFISVRPSQGIEQTSVSKTVSKVLKVHPGLYKENVGQRKGLAGGQEGSSWPPSWGQSCSFLWLGSPCCCLGSHFGFHHGLLCLHLFGLR